MAMALVTTTALALTGCAQSQAPSAGSVTLTVWHHDGQATERAAMIEQTARFNAAQHDVVAKVIEVPEDGYTDKVQLAAVNGTLPDVLDFDGPNMQNYAYQGKLLALDKLLSTSVRADLTSSIRAQGTYLGHLYSVGNFDSGLGLYADRRALKAAGINPPTSIEEAWTPKEFDQVLATLAARDKDHKVLELSLSYGQGEWFTYGFAPVVWSAGGSLGVPPRFGNAAGSLATPAVTQALERIQRWTSRYVEPAPKGVEDSFLEGLAPLSWGGHWVYPAYHKALGANLIVIPLPDFGLGTKTSSGSWNWGVSATTKHPQAAAQFLDFLMSTNEVLAVSAANGAPPGTTSGLAQSPLYSPTGPLALFAQQLTNSCGIQPKKTCVAVIRPATAAYPVITAAFQTVMSVVFTKGDVAAALEVAAGKIDTDYKANHGYEPVQ